MEDENLTEGEKIIAGLSYIIFFLSFMNGNNKGFNRFHANQGLLLLMLIVIANVVNITLSYFPVLYWVSITLFMVAILYFFIIGVKSAAAGEMKEFPIIGKIKFIK